MDKLVDLSVGPPAVGVVGSNNPGEGLITVVGDMATNLLSLERGIHTGDIEGTGDSSLSDANMECFS